MGQEPHRDRTASLCFQSGGIMEPRQPGECPPQRSGQCRLNTPSRPTWACPRAALTLISLTSEGYLSTSTLLWSGCCCTKTALTPPHTCAAYSSKAAVRCILLHELCP